jgi:hypothetical protein
MNAGVRSFRQLLRGGMVSKMKMMPRLRSFAAIKTAHGRGPMTATPGRTRVPNRSGNPQGYNSKLFRSKEHMAKAFQSLGYKVSMRNPKEDSEAAKKFQNDFNRCSRRFSLKWGVVSVNGMISPDTLRALEIALIFSRKRQAKMMEVTKRKVSLADAWRKTCNKSGKGGQPKPRIAPGGTGSIRGDWANKPNIAALRIPPKNFSAGKTSVVVGHVYDPDVRKVFNKQTRKSYRVSWAGHNNPNARMVTLKVDGLGTGNYMIERGYAKNQGSRAFAASRPQPRDSWGYTRKWGSRHGTRTKARRWVS